MRRSLLVAGTVAVALVGTVLPLVAQGSSVYTQSACMSGRNGAGVANPCSDGSAIFYNPAALSLQPSSFGVGVTLVRTENEFIYDQHGGAPGTPATVERGPAMIPVPHGYFQHRINDRLAAGIGVWAPYGLGITWPEAFEGRYIGYDNALRGLYIQPTVAYQLVPGRFAVGVGADVVLGSLEINQRLDAPQLGLRGTDIADARLAGSGTGFTGHVGVWATPIEGISLGARYLHSVDIDLTGDAEFRQITGNPLDAAIAAQFQRGQQLGPDQAVETQITLPAQLVVGLEIATIPGLSLMGDYQWTGWSSFDRFDITFQQPDNGGSAEQVLVLDYRDAHTFRVGAEYSAIDRLALRTGWVYNTAATPMASPLLPEGDRNIVALGAGYEIIPGLVADVMYQMIIQQDRRGRVRPGEPAAGIFTANANLFGVTLSYRFGGFRN
jgi:long-chain fatty acid transport protein